MQAIAFWPRAVVLVNGLPAVSFMGGIGSITVSDSTGFESDTVSIVLPLRDANLGLLIAGGEMEVIMGYFPFQMQSMGKFVIDEITASGPPDIIRITGRAAPFSGTSEGKRSMAEQKSRDWPEGATIEDIASTITGDHGLEPKIADDVKSIVPGQISQVDESDLNFLIKIAIEHDLTVKPAAGMLVISKRGKGRSATGKPLPPILVKPSKISTWRGSIYTRDPAGTVIATYRDLEKAEDVEVTEGEPIHRLKKSFPNEASAQAAAKTARDKSKRRAGKLEITMPGDPNMMAECPVFTWGLPGISFGNWIVEQVTHTISDQGYSTSFTAVPKVD